MNFMKQIGKISLLVYTGYFTDFSQWTIIRLKARQNEFHIQGHNNIIRKIQYLPVIMM